MLTGSDEHWLRRKYPTLVPGGCGVAGEIEFTATYDARTNRFLILPNQAAEELPGVTLSGAFQIRITERPGKASSHLPALFVDGIEPTPDRHFNQRDRSACLCSPFDEGDFLRPEFHFPIYLEQLVIPFLYGQVFYSMHARWPWAEYAHGAAGVLEAYSKIHDPNRAEECLSQLQQDLSWPRIRSALRQHPHVKGHTPCFCAKMDHIRRCHPGALEGARRLQQDLKTRGISVP